MKQAKKFKIVIFAIVIAVIILVPALFYLKSQNNSEPKAIINNQEIKLEIVNTPAEMERGLSGRESLWLDNGMLFVYDKYVMPSFWMKDMKFPIDIIWIRDNLVIGVEKNMPIPTPDSLPTHSPSELVNYVLEVNAGFVEKKGIKVGDGVTFENLN